MNQVKIVEILEKIVKIHNLKIFFVCVYKIVEISAETWKKCGIETAMLFLIILQKIKNNCS